MSLFLVLGTFPDQHTLWVSCMSADNQQKRQGCSNGHWTCPLISLSLVDLLGRRNGPHKSSLGIEVIFALPRVWGSAFFHSVMLLLNFKFLLISPSKSLCAVAGNRNKLTKRFLLRNTVSACSSQKTGEGNLFVQAHSQMTVKYDRDIRLLFFPFWSCAGQDIGFRKECFRSPALPAA